MSVSDLEQNFLELLVPYLVPYLVGKFVGKRAPYFVVNFGEHL